MLLVVLVELQNPPRLTIPEDTSHAAMASLDKLTDQVPGNFMLAPLSQYREIVERPLFSPSRRPPVVSDTVDQEEIADSSVFTLLGVAVTPERMVALVQINKAKKVVRLDVGEEVDGWTLEAVHKDSVTLRNGDLTEDLPLKQKPDESPSTDSKAQRVVQDAKAGPNKDANNQSPQSPDNLSNLPLYLRNKLNR